MFSYCSSALPIHRYKDRRRGVWPSGFFCPKTPSVLSQPHSVSNSSKPQLSRSSWAAVYLSERWELRAPSPISYEEACGIKGGFSSPLTVFALLTGEGLGPCSMSVHSRPLASWLVTLVHRCLWPVSDLIGWYLS